jgi:hypothetical protein
MVVDMKFSDLNFHELYDGVQAVMGIGDYELSVVKHSMSYGGKQGLYEIMVSDGINGVSLPGITNDGDSVRGYLTEDDVSSIMKKLAMVRGPSDE